MTKEKFYLVSDDEEEFVGDYESDLEGGEEDDEEENEEAGFLDEDEEDA